ncbi:hypothetical protein [Priestia megaterium]|uniref:hypothetical protein n=1 Tax=Priestia megaterium TaxID=1404 RepID=UPI000BA4F155|nr:hypothetical protein [Priestia megaterium]PAK50000.1 hypothetical protein CHH47_12585 [Priestia megaterium]
MNENIVHITVGVLFDLYVKDLIKKETYDECIRAYKEHVLKAQPTEETKACSGSINLEGRQNINKPFFKDNK